jgi:hypothetical protein
LPGARLAPLLKALLGLVGPRREQLTNNTVNAADPKHLGARIGILSVLHTRAHETRRRRKLIDFNELS